MTRREQHHELGHHHAVFMRGTVIHCINRGAIRGPSDPRATIGPRSPSLGMKKAQVMVMCRLARSIARTLDGRTNFAGGASIGASARYFATGATQSQFAGVLGDLAQEIRQWILHASQGSIPKSRQMPLCAQSEASSFSAPTATVVSVGGGGGRRQQHAQQLQHQTMAQQPTVASPNAWASATSWPSAKG